MIARTRQYGMPAPPVPSFKLARGSSGVGRVPTFATRSVRGAKVGGEALAVKPMRPTERGDPRFLVRRPSTSSFPSGHSSAAFFAAAILTTATGRDLAPLWYAIATIVALSRVYVRIHHASDVVAGAGVGAVLGLLGSRIFSILVH